MTQPFEVHIALRYLFARRKQAFISVISLVSTLGVIVGVMALVLALALMTGMQRELRNRILGATAHLFVWKHGGISDYQAEAAKLRTVPGVTGAAPAVIGKALISSGRGEAFITLKGIDPALERSVTDIAGAMKSGTLDALADDPGDGPPGIVIGADLAQTLGVVEGDEVTVLTPQGNLTPMGVYPRSRRAAGGRAVLPRALRVRLRLRAGLAPARAPDARPHGGRRHRAAHRRHLRAPERSPPRSRRRWARRTSAQTWAELNRALFQALWLEKMAISITIGLIVMVAALNIVASLVLLVMEKSPDIAILKTMGASSRSIMAVFMLQGLVIGAVGTFIGASLGYAVARSSIATS